MSRYEKKLMENPTDEDALGMIDYFKNDLQRRLELEETTEWRTENMEYDLRISAVITEKCSDEIYAQHLYAALCNNEFIKNDVWPILADKRWSCSWRHAGGVISNIREEGDYIDWYCSGIQQSTDLDDDQFRALTKPEQEAYLRQAAYVAEGVITDEIRQDLLTLGWLVADI
jgi:hypothetical protein